MYRRWHTLTILGLAALVVAAAAFGPCFARAVQEATVRAALTTATVAQSGISAVVGPGTAGSSVQPSVAARFFRPAIVETEQPAVFALRGRDYHTSLTSRDEQCAHLQLAQGRCPNDGQAVAISTSAAAALGLRLGQRIQLSVTGVPNADLLVPIVGLYRPIDNNDTYWFGRSYLSSKAGLSVQTEGTGSQNGTNVVDAFFTDPKYLTVIAQQAAVAARNDPKFAPRVTADIELVPQRVGLSNLPTLLAAVQQVRELTGDTADLVTTGLPALIQHLRDGFDQAAATERALTLQLVALALIAFAVVVTSAIGQRSRELALARLRGRSPLVTARLFVQEIAGVVLLAVVPGTAAALGLTELASRLWLGPGGRPELLSAVVISGLGAAAVALATTVLVGWRVSRLSISDLLRAVPAQRPIVAIGALEAAIGTLAVAGLYLALSGNNNTTNGISLLTPMLLAALAGLLLGRLMITTGHRVGPWAWRHGLIAIGLAGASITRRRGYRLVAAVLSITGALVVFAGQQASIGAANRAARADAETGAAVVLDVTASSISSVLAAVRVGDPSGAYATTVAIPSVTTQAPVIAVDAPSFARVASWGWSGQRPSDALLAALQPRESTPPVSITATALYLHLADLQLQTVGDVSAGQPSLARPRGPVFLSVLFQRTAGGTTSANFGPLPPAAQALTLTSALDCGSGCKVRSISIGREGLDPNQVGVSGLLLGVSTNPHGPLIGLGQGSDWGTTTPALPLVGAEGSTHLQLRTTAGGLQLSAVDAGGAASAQHLDTPIAIPALYAGSIDQSTDQLNYQIEPGLDGSPLRIRPIGHISFIPRIGSPAVLVDLAEAASGSSAPMSDVQVWLASDNPSREARLTQALLARHVQVTHRATAAAVQDIYAHAAPALGADLSIGVALLAALIGTVLLILTITGTSRTRMRDHTAMRLVGVVRYTIWRSVITELAVVILTSTLVGALAGVIGARLTLPQLPLFSTTPSVPIPVRITIQWHWLAVVTAGLLAMLVVTAGTLAARLTVRTTVDPQQGISP